MKNNMIKKGVMIANKRGTFVIDDMDNNYIAIRDVMIDNKGAYVYGKKKIISTQELDNYKLV